MSKEEVARGYEVNRKRALIVDKFYPALVKATISVDEAKMLNRALADLLMEDVLAVMKVRKLGEIKEKILHKLSPDGERLEEIRELLDTLDEETLFVTREIVEGMSNAIEQMIIDEMQDKSLADFKPDWDKMLRR